MRKTLLALSLATGIVERGGDFERVTYGAA